MRRLRLSMTRLSQCALAATGATAWLLACSGSKFVPDESCARAACGAAAGAELGSGGALSSGGSPDSGGESGFGGDSGAAGGGAPASHGGAGATGDAGAPGGSSSAGESGGAQGGEGGQGEPDPSGFPLTPVLDRFNRQGPQLGPTWIGAADEYSIKEQALWCESCVEPALWSVPFGPDQEAFATLAHFDDGASEINLVLKAQASLNCELLEVFYSPVEASVRVAYCTGDKWTELEATPLILRPGDRLGGRAHADGKVEIYANDQLVTAIDASGFPHMLGRIGVNGESGDSGNTWDDFGGGAWR